MKIYAIRSHIMKLYESYLYDFSSIESFADAYWLNRQSAFRIVAIGSKLLRKAV